MTDCASIYTTAFPVVGLLQINQRPVKNTRESTRLGIPSTVVCCKLTREFSVSLNNTRNINLQILSDPLQCSDCPETEL